MTMFKTAAKNHLVLDLQAALHAIGGNETVLLKMAVTFHRDMPRILEQLRQALIDENAALIMRESHTIKGASDNIKAGMLSEVAHVIEKAASSENYEDASSLLKLLEIELEKVRNALVESGILDMKSLDFL